jgi:NAD-dependent dihydropyrimidine dehydrogenase PreA subunit
VKVKLYKQYVITNQVTLLFYVIAKLIRFLLIMAAFQIFMLYNEIVLTFQKNHYTTSNKNPRDGHQLNNTYCKIEKTCTDCSGCFLAVSNKCVKFDDKLL